MSIIGGGTRYEMATALRLIANALDGNPRGIAQKVEDIDGAGWNDMAFITTISLLPKVIP